MATSSVQLIPYVLRNLSQVPVKSVLDIGMGFGNYGCLIRDYYDLAKAESPEQLERHSWRMRIDGIEPYAEFISDRQRSVYDDIYVGTALDVLPDLGSYDVILLVAVLVHMPKEEGTRLVNMMYAHCNQLVLITTPTRPWPQDDIFENPYEVHHDVTWQPSDFTGYRHVADGIIVTEERITILSKRKQVSFIDPFKKRSKPSLKSRARPLVAALLGEKAAGRIGRAIRGRSE